MVELARGDQHMGPYPSKIGMITDKWWDEVLDGHLYLLDMGTFPVPTTAASLRAYLYKEAAKRARRVKVIYYEGVRLFYIQAYTTVPFHPAPPADARSVPPVPRVWVSLSAPGQQRGPQPGVITISMQRALGSADIAILRAAGWTFEPPPDNLIAAPTSAPPFIQASAPKPLTNAASRRTCSCGTKNMAYHDEGCALLRADEHRIAALAAFNAQGTDLSLEVEEAWIREVCNCGSEDVDRHPPSCAVWG